MGKEEGYEEPSTLDLVLKPTWDLYSLGVKEVFHLVFVDGTKKD